ncbi:hypothetical protein ABIB82_001262 [Bradyrhizobium sp. i1.8.4]
MDARVRPGHDKYGGARNATNATGIQLTLACF